jgi:serine/threonine protein kinase
LTEAEAARVISQTLRAIEHCHAHGVVHRDLKPQNLLLLQKGPLGKATIKVVDFGVSRQYDPGVDDARGQAYTKVIGTRSYMAPEIFQSRGYGQQVDVWSLGVILFQMLILPRIGE